MKKIFYLVFCFSLIIVSLFSFNSQKVFAESGVWTERTTPGSSSWHSVATSSDGVKLFAVDGSSNVYISKDSGVTWTTKKVSSDSTSFYSIASSSDGNKLVVGSYYNYIYTSTDGGTTWVKRTSLGSGMCFSIASSSDGIKLAALDYDGSIYTSTDSGVTWTERIPSSEKHFWTSIASSSDGTKLIAVGNTGHMFTSVDSGVTWTKRDSINGKWYTVASSSDGTKLAVGPAYGPIYTSTDSGATWVARNTISGFWTSIASSADGTKLAAVYNGRHIYLSNDSGITWTIQTSIDGWRGWQTIASSSDGSKLVAGAYSSYIYTYSSSNSTPNSSSTTTPSVTTSSASSITKTSAVLNGNITSNGGSSISTSGFKYGLNTSYGKITTDGPTSTGTYSKEISGLVCGTTYHFSVYATNAKGTTSGSDQSFTTTACNDVNKTPYSLSASNITPNSLILSWSNPAYYPTCFVNYGTNYNTVYNYNGIGNAGGCSNRLISGLSPDTTYYFKVQGIYDGIYTGYSDIYSVKTLSSLSPTIPTSTNTPSIITYPASSITKTSAVLNGNITSNGGSSISTSGFKYGLNTSYGKITTDGPTSTGTYSKEISGLVCGTTYHFSVYATNAKGSSQEDYKSFTTKSCLVLDPEIKLTETPSVPLSRNLKITYPRTQGNDVVYLQTYLNSNNYNCGIVDGVFGTKTKDAVVKFQLDNGLKPDGVFGPISRVKAGL